MGNLRGINSELTLSNRFMTMIKKERFKNKLIMYSVIAVITIAILYILFGWLL